LKRLLKSAKEKLNGNELLAIYKEAQIIAIESVLFHLERSTECDFKYPCREWEGIIQAKKIIKKSHPKSRVIAKNGTWFSYRKF